MVSIALHKQDANDIRSNIKQLKAVKKLLPFIKPNKKGCKVISIVEHDLARGGIYHLEFYDDGRILLIHTLYSRVSIKATFKTIEEAFEYVRENLWV